MDSAVARLMIVISRVVMRRVAAVIAAFMIAAVGGCSPTIAVDAAPGAATPACGLILARTPTTLDGLPRRQTTSQATTAWGEPRSAITLRCGVEQPGPSTNCVSIGDDASSVDWISVQTETGWRFTTYGRDPAVEVNVPESLGLTQPGLIDLMPALANARVTARCT